MKHLTFDIRPTEEECCSKKVIDLYNWLKDDSWFVLLIKDIGYWQSKVTYGSIEGMYLRRITHLIDITIESDLDCMTLATII